MLKTVKELKMTSWLSTRAFITGAIIGVMAAWETITVHQDLISATVTIVTSGVFWGWILTKFVKRWFAVPAADDGPK